MILKSVRSSSRRADDDEDEESGSWRRRRVRIVDVNAQLTCTLCRGYYVDATTIIECLHSFCRSCIVRYLAANKYCPVCDVQVHKTRPLLNIRPDKTLQDVVYKLVPRLLHNELARRRDFYAAHPAASPSGAEQRAEMLYQHVLAPDESVCVALTYHDSEAGDTRYLQCPAAVTVACLQKLIRNKYELTQRHRVDLLHKADALGAHLTLVDIVCMYVWRRGPPLPLTYRIYESAECGMTLLPEPPSTKTSTSNNNNNNDDHAAGAYREGWKEVQLRISENGEMSVAGGQLLNDLEGSGSTTSAKPTVKNKTTNEKRKDAVKKEPPKLKPISSKRKTSSSGDGKDEPPAKKTATAVSSKPIILNHAAGLLNLSNNHPLRKHPLSLGGGGGGGKQEKSKSPPIILNSKFGTKLSVESTSSTTSTTMTTTYTPINVPSVQKLSAARPSTTAASTSKPPGGYKTLGEPPKVWNPQLPPPARPDLRQIRPAKFFKVRNNMPRYLGNPASGVKPLYAVQTTDVEKKEPTTSEMKRSVVKIDPQTLRPLSDVVTPSTTTTTSSELKINTSSVSIFKPLKERKSPHSPNMSKSGRGAASSPSPTNVQPPGGGLSTTTTSTTTTTTTTTTTKAGLSFTPTNPFVPNHHHHHQHHHAPQFMFPQAGAAGFHSYDPMMAAYQSIMATYQRMPYAKYDLHNLQQMGVYPLAGLMMNAAGGAKSPFAGALEEQRKDQQQQRKSTAAAAAAGSSNVPVKKARLDSKEKDWGVVAGGSNSSRVKYTSITITPKTSTTVDTAGQKVKEGKEKDDEKVDVKAKNGSNRSKEAAIVESQKEKDEAGSKEAVVTQLKVTATTVGGGGGGGGGKGEKSLQSALDKLTKAMKPVTVPTSEETRNTNNVKKDHEQQQPPPAPTAPIEKTNPPKMLNNVVQKDEQQEEDKTQGQKNTSVGEGDNIKMAEKTDAEQTTATTNNTDALTKPPQMPPIAKDDKKEEEKEEKEEKVHCKHEVAMETVTPSVDSDEKLTMMTSSSSSLESNNTTTTTVEKRKATEANEDQQPNNSSSGSSSTSPPPIDVATIVNSTVATSGAAATPCNNNTDTPPTTTTTTTHSEPEVIATTTEGAT